MNKHNKLTLQEREEIARLVAQGHSGHDIAAQLNRSQPTISRELRRTGMSRDTYRSNIAQVDRNTKAALKGRKRKICKDSKFHRIIKHHIIDLRWSPEQISQRFKITSKSPKYQISHETIYKYIYSIEDKDERKEWINHLRRKRKKRYSRQHTKEKRGKIPNATSIHQRPQVVQERKEIGHWEGDTVVGINHKSAIGTFVERVTRFTLILDLHEGKTADCVSKAVVEAFESLPLHLRKSITYDNGHEMAHHEKITRQISAQVYFADPGCPGQRGTNENTNGLIREFFPKKTDFSLVSVEELKHVQMLINRRPRKILGYMTPEHLFYEHYGPEQPNKEVLKEQQRPCP